MSDRLDVSKPYQTCVEGQNAVAFIQGWRGYNAQHEYVGDIDPATCELIEGSAPNKKGGSRKPAEPLDLSKLKDETPEAGPVDLKRPFLQVQSDIGKRFGHRPANMVEAKAILEHFALEI